MARELSPKDIVVLKKVAPECAGLECAGSKAPYRSILPPLSNHYAKSEEDFRNRISALDDEDLEYLLSLIKTGEESLGCVPPHYMTLFLELISERMGKESAEEIMAIYMKLKDCEPVKVTRLF
ncbi:hypothetical protein RE476_03485 [Methanolobus mangrovi]|uniref:Uncharacterized protein n=1 Tax=Methanolobus mangrovi TaxID=3072977 RepID=A0AA51UHC6_9EURY|nr:hypothetical protein [Methanolobus mangrovi]WMW22899.1 hypothetical protein RE476_03485 [Methanolobus mangrovi]